MLDDLEVFVSPVFYSTREILSRHSVAIDKAFAIFRTAMDADRPLMNDAALFDQFVQTFCRTILASVLIWNCLTSKHTAYDREQEVRLIIMGERDKLIPKIKTRLRGSEIVPYIAQPLAIRGRERILEIVTGPAAGADAERTVRTMLRSFNVDDKYRSSRPVFRIALCRRAEGREERYAFLLLADEVIELARVIRLIFSPVKWALLALKVSGTLLPRHLDSSFVRASFDHIVGERE